MPHSENKTKFRKDFVNVFFIEKEKDLDSTLFYAKESSKSQWNIEIEKTSPPPKVSKSETNDVTKQLDFSWSKENRSFSEQYPPMNTTNEKSYLYPPSSMDNKPRMRICFDPEHEIPKLQAWFAENNHPSRLQVEDYVTILNSLESRKGKKPLDVNNVIYWFKNTRAAVKRAQAKTDRTFLDPFYIQRLQGRSLQSPSDR